jgi:peptidoglycan hydrolase CwlO-like protein
MTNEDFQSLVLEKLEILDNGQKSLEGGQKDLVDAQKSIEAGQKKLDERHISLENSLKKLESRQTSLENRQLKSEEDMMYIRTRQDETYNIVAAIDHSNQVGRAELDGHNLRIAKFEGKFIKVAEACTKESQVSSL